jgi:SAM-dependent methyltransferase
MPSFDDLIAEAAAADVTGWGFGWLDGRATEERPPWGYARLLADRLATVNSALDLDTGGGEVVDEAPQLPALMCATEGWPANLARARARLGPRGVRVYEVSADGVLPFPDGSFELVSSRHPVRPGWAEIARVLVPGGRYFAQHVGSASARELSEFFLGPLGGADDRDPRREAAAASAAGLSVLDLRTFRGRMEFFDVGAVVWILRKCVWWVPDFTVGRYRDRLHDLDDLIRRDGRFVAHSSRHLIEAIRRDPGGREE